MKCPMCQGCEICVECCGLGKVPCEDCDGLGYGCARCHRVGYEACVPCAGTGVCPRCKGEGAVETSSWMFPVYTPDEQRHEETLSRLAWVKRIHDALENDVLPTI